MLVKYIYSQIQNTVIPYYRNGGVVKIKDLSIKNNCNSILMGTKYKNM